MQKYILIFLVIFTITIVNSQNEYKTKSGIIYKVGDTLKLGNPVTLLNSMLSNSSAGSWNTIFDLKNKNLSNTNFINKKVIITKIELFENTAKLYFTLFRKDLYVLIDEAIASREVITPVTENLNQSKELDKYDKIKKLKELLDMGAITNDEYEIEKKNIA
jgi:hypothetical protein